MKLKDRIKKELTWTLIWASPLVVPNLASNMITRVALDSGFSKEYIEREYREENPKQRPYVGHLVDVLTRPGRELAYMTTEQYKFPWRGYKRHIFH